MSDFLPSASSESTIKTAAGNILVGTSTYIPSEHPVVLQFGPLTLQIDYAEAVDLGTELIRAAHHHQAALAEYRQALAVTSVSDQAVAA